MAALSRLGSIARAAAFIWTTTFASQSVAAGSDDSSCSESRLGEKDPESCTTVSPPAGADWSLLQDTVARSRGLAMAEAETPRIRAGTPTLARKGRLPSPSPSPFRAPSPAGFGLIELAGAPNVAKVKEAIEKRKRAEAMGDGQHYTSHGCHCMRNWTYNGELIEGCSKVEAEFAHGYHWCQVTELCENYTGQWEEGKPDSIWDYCAGPEDIEHHMTVHGCHCMPHFEWKGTYYHQCAKTSKGDPWCYIFETDNGGCSHALRTEHHGQHWDYCWRKEDVSPILTKEGCHCLPKFIVNEKKYEGCSKVPGYDDPKCVVWEDDELCKKGQSLDQKDFKALLVDTCQLMDSSEEEFLMSLDSASDGCYCQPEWEHEGETYKGCDFTESSNGKKMCYLIVDETRCKEADGQDEAGRRWKYCVEETSAATTAKASSSSAPVTTTAAASVTAPGAAAGTTVSATTTGRPTLAPAPLPPPLPPPAPLPPLPPPPPPPMKVNVIPIIVPMVGDGAEAPGIIGAETTPGPEIAEGGSGHGSEQSSARHERQANTTLWVFLAVAVAAGLPTSTHS